MDCHQCIAKKISITHKCTQLQHIDEYNLSLFLTKPLFLHLKKRSTNKWWGLTLIQKGTEYATQVSRVENINSLQSVTKCLVINLAKTRQNPKRIHSYA